MTKKGAAAVRPLVPTRPTGPARALARPLEPGGRALPALPLAAGGRGGAHRRVLDRRAGHPVPGPPGHRRGAPRPGRAACCSGPSAACSPSPSSPRCSASSRRGCPPRSASGSCTACGRRSSRHLQRQSLGFFTRTSGGEVQSRLTNDIGGMQSVVTSTATSVASNATTVIGTAVAMAAPELAAVPALAGRAAAGDLADPPGRPDAPHDHRAAAAAPRRPALPGRGGPVGQRRAARQDPRRRPGPVAAVRRRPPTTSSRSRCARSWPAAGGWPR